MRQHVWFYINHENKCYHVSFQWYLGSAKVQFVLDYEKTQLDTYYFFVFCCFTAVFSFLSLFTLLLDCTSIDTVIQAPVESSLTLAAKDKTFKHHQGCLEHSSLSFFYQSLLFHRSHSTLFIPQRNKSFLNRESSIQQFFHKRCEKRSCEKPQFWSSTIVLLIFSWNIQVFSIFFFLTNAPAPESKSLP